VRLPSFLATLIFLHFVIYATVFFDIPIARQIVGFLYFSFIPGFVFIKLLGMDELGRLETILISLGFSISFLILAGLLINEFGIMLGFSRPLSLVPMVVVLNSLILLGGVLVHLKNRNTTFWSIRPFQLRPIALLFICLPILSVVGAMWVNIYGNNSILLIMIVMISVLFGIVIISKNVLPPKLYPFVMFLIALSLLYHASLISSNLVSFGSDVQIEFFLSKTTLEGARWNSTFWSSTTTGFWHEAYGRLNAMLSITILPSVYSILLNLDLNWIFKTLFPFVFSFVPLGLYQIWRKYTSWKYALVSTFLFVAQLTFFTEMLGLNRQMIGELFFVLLLFVFLTTRLKPVNKWLCFTIFSLGLVTSHYALAEIFLFFLSFLVVSSAVLKKRVDRSMATMLVLFFVLMFTWYIYTSASTVFDSFLAFGSNVYGQLGEFLNVGSRGTTVLMGLGLEAAPSTWNAISRVFAYLVQGLMVIGFLGMLLRKTKTRFETNYFLLNSAAIFLLAALILVPGLANTLSMTRFYHILLFFLSPLCAIGVAVFVESVLRRKKEVIVFSLLLVVLIPYFLFQTGFIFELTGTQNYSLSLSKHQMSDVFLGARLGYFDEYEVSGASWISRNVAMRNSMMYVDEVSRSILVGYGMVQGDYLETLANTTVLSRDDYVYLGRVNLVDGVVVSSDLWNSGNISEIWITANKIYSNGKSELHSNSFP
jgi:uncharacterized membrane protein